MTAIDLYTLGTPNGVKISILLEALQVKYTAHKIDISTGEQKKEWFLKINPNGRIPAIVDHTEGEPGVPVFESGAIMLYLVDKYDPENRFTYAHGSAEYYEMLQWLMFQMSGVGPMQGQAHHFIRYAPEKIQYGITRYVSETKRLYSVLEARLQQNSGFLVGNHYSVADFATFGWVYSAPNAGIDISNFPALEAWTKDLAGQEYVKRGMAVPEPYRADYLDPETKERALKSAEPWVTEH